MVLLTLSKMIGQSTLIENLPAYYSKLYYLQNGYAFTNIGKKNKDDTRDFLVKYYDENLNNTHSISINTPKNQSKESLVFNGANFLSIFQDFKEKKYVYYIHDMESNELAKKEYVFKEKIKGEKNYKETLPHISFYDETGFVFFKSVRGEKWGYTVEKVDNKLNTVWTYSFIPEKGYVDYLRPVVNENGIAFLEFVPNRSVQMSVGGIGKDDKDFYNLVILDKETGKLSGKYNLLQSGDYLTPTSIVIEEDQSVLLGGMYTNSISDKKNNSTGTYLAKISAQGKEVFMTKLPWKDESNGLQKFLSSGKKKKGLSFTPKVKYHRISKVDGKYYLVGEIFEKAISAGGMAAKLALKALGDKEEGPSDISFNILDFIVLTFDQDGKLVNKALAKKPKKTIFQESNDVLSGGMSQAENLEFDYAFTTKDGTNDKGVFFKAQETKKLKTTTYFAYFDLKHTGEEIEVKRIPFKFQGKMFDGDYDLQLFPYSGNKILKYEYYRDKSKLYLDVLSF